MGLVAQAQRQVHLVRTGSGVGKECDIVLVEGIVAVVAQSLHNDFALGIELLVVEQRLGFDGEINSVAQDQVAQAIIGDVVAHRPHPVGLVEGDVVVHRGLFLLGVEGDIAGDHALEVTLVDECTLQLILARHCQCGVVDHWRAAHTPNPLVEPVGGVFS